MHISLWAQVAHSSFIEGSHMTENMASGLALSRWLNFIFVLVTILAAFGNIYLVDLTIKIVIVYT
jgi:hypothetical protein